MQLQSWIGSAKHTSCNQGDESSVAKVKALWRGSALLTAIVGSTFLGLARSQKVTATNLSGREVRRSGIPPAVRSVVPPQSIFPETIFTLSLSPSNYFTDVDSRAFTLSASEKGQSTLPNWLEFKYKDHQFMGILDTSGNSYAAHVVDNLAYLADDTSGLVIIDVSNPATPTLVGTYNTVGNARGIDVVGYLAYVADGSPGLAIINVSNPASPTLVGTYSTIDQARSVHVVGNVAYVAVGSSGLQIINVSNPALPTLTGAYDTPGFSNSVHVVGNLAYVTDQAFGLAIINVSNPASPTLTGTYDTSGNANGVQVVGNFAYVADGTAGLAIIDVSSPATPILTGSYDTSGTASGIKVVGDLAYVADGSYGLSLIDVSNPAIPRLAGTYDTPGTASGIYSVGYFAYVADGNAGLHIIEERKQLFGIPSKSDIDNYEIELIATDTDLNSASSTFAVRVEGPPVTSGSIPNKLANIGTSFSYFVDKNVFPDPNGDVVYYSAQQTNQNPLPSWLSFASIGIFSGTPQSSDTGTYQINVFAFDGFVLGKANTTFNFIAEHFPQVTASIANQGADLNRPYTFTVPSQTFSDQDVGDQLTYSATLSNGDPLPSWLSFNATTAQFSGTPTNSNTGSFAIKVSAIDTPGAVTSTTFTLSVGAFPVLLNPISDQIAAVDMPFRFAVPGNIFSTPTGEYLTYRATKGDGSFLPSWLGFVGSRLEFQGTARPSDKGNVVIKVLAEDTKGGIAESLFSLNVVDSLSQELVRVGGSFAYTIPSDMISAPLGPVTYTVTLGDGSPLPPWLSYNSATHVISGVPPSDSDGSYNILVTADDGVQAPVLGTVTLTVGLNAGPKVSNPLSNQVAQVGQNFRFVVPDNTFVDPNGDSLTLNAMRANGRALPSWLTFSGRTLEGKPGRGDTGAFSDKTVPLQICGTDGDQDACSIFDLGVQGTSKEEQTLAILGPLATVAGLGIAWYQKRGLLLNPWNREKYDKGTKNASIGQPLNFKLETPKSEIEIIRAFEGKRMFLGLPAPQALDERGWLDWLKLDKPIAGAGSLLPSWLEYDLGGNELLSSLGPSQDDAGIYTVRVFGQGSVILEEFKLNVGGQAKDEFEMSEF